MVMPLLIKSSLIGRTGLPMLAWPLVDTSITRLAALGAVSKSCPAKAKASPVAVAHTRIPAGHPEGYLEAFANVYRNFAMHIQAKLDGKEQNPLYDYPSVSDGVRGMQFIYKVVESSKKNRWISF